MDADQLSALEGQKMTRLPACTYNGAVILFGTFIAITVVIIVGLFIEGIDQLVRGREDEKMEKSNRGRLDHGDRRPDLE